MSGGTCYGGDTRHYDTVIFYFQTKYSLYFIIVLNAEKLTYNIQNPRVVHDFRYWLTIQYVGVINSLDCDIAGLSRSRVQVSEKCEQILSYQFKLRLIGFHVVTWRIMLKQAKYMHKHTGCGRQLL